MPCDCVEKALYALKCSSIPIDIFSGVSCSHTSGKAAKASSSEAFVRLTLCPDTMVSKSDDITTWQEVYHGTTALVVNSILTHGMLLMSGDTLRDGTVLKRRLAKVDANDAVWTYPQSAGALLAAGTETFDGGLTEFKIIVKLRQKPGTYEVHPKLGCGSHDVWSTKRRGTLFIEVLDVYVTKSRGTVAPEPLMTIPRYSYFTTFSCPVQQQAFNVMKLLNLPQDIFNMKYNRCYCTKCYPDSYVNYLVIAGEKYAIPRGWTRFGLATNPVFSKINDIWKSWHMSFHGCHPSNVMSILRSRALLIPHDFLPDGEELTVVCSADENQKYYFLSPEIGYSAHPWYAKPVPFIDADGKRKYFQTVVIFKVMPESYRKDKETEGGVMKMFDDYSIIAANEVEWFSARRGCTHPYGLLVRVVDASNLDELYKFFNLPENSGFRQTPEYTL